MRVLQKPNLKKVQTTIRMDEGVLLQLKQFSKRSGLSQNQIFNNRLHNN